MRVVKRAIIAIAGGTVLLLGAAMIILPGPAILVIPAGLAILGLEFHWAKRWLAKVKEYALRAKTGVAPEPVAVPAQDHMAEKGAGQGSSRVATTEIKDLR